MLTYPFYVSIGTCAAGKCLLEADAGMLLTRNSINVYDGPVGIGMSMHDSYLIRY
jgi:hypothetical protein